MKWTKYGTLHPGWGLKIGDGFVAAGISWRSASATEDPGYVARVNGNELPGRRTDDLESTKRHVEAYILMKLAECQKQMEDANA